MELINQSWKWVQLPDMPLELIELAGRTCYKSEELIGAESSRRFAKMLIKCGHESVIDHASASVRFVTNRGVTHELVRHRLCAFSQESTRYVNYRSESMQFIKPVWWVDQWEGLTPLDVNRHAHSRFIESLEYAEESYNDLIEYGWRPEQAREVLPNALKTEIVVTANLREWRHIFRLRTSKAAHPQIRELMRSCLAGFQSAVPVIFDDI